jgi:heptaprenyl diphosphate synthase
MNSSPIDDSTYDRGIVMVALGIILHRLEALLPLPTKWVKLGLANLMTLMALIYLGTREAFIVTLLRVMLGSILAETSLGPIFFSAWQVLG